MGFNTTVVVLNDALDQIETDPNFGKKLVAAIRKAGCYRKPVDVSAGNHVNAASVIETHHADFDVVVAVGQNYGQVISKYAGPEIAASPEKTERILRDLADQFGFSLRKKPARK